MTFQLSTPMKVVALLGLVLLLLAGGGATYTMALQKHQEAETVAITPNHSPSAQGTVKFATHPPVTKPHVAPKPVVVIDQNLPGPLRHALHQSKLVVAVIWAPGVAGDGDAVQAARQGAKAAHVGFTALNVNQDPVAAALAAWVPHASDPTVLVVGRPGQIVTELDGWVDKDMVAQAALDARSR
jgi:hypothetical protein